MNEALLFCMLCLAGLMLCASCSSGSSNKGEGSTTDDDDMTSGDDSANDDDNSIEDQLVQYEFRPTQLYPMEIASYEYVTGDDVEISLIAGEINEFGNLILILPITIPATAIDGNGIIKDDSAFIGSFCGGLKGRLKLRQGFQGEVLQYWMPGDRGPDGTYYQPTYQMEEVALTFVGGTHTRIKMVLGPTCLSPTPPDPAG